MLQKNNSQGVDKRVILWYNGGVVTGRGALEGGLDILKKVCYNGGLPIICTVIPIKAIVIIKASNIGNINCKIINGHLIALKAFIH